MWLAHQTAKPGPIARKGATSCRSALESPAIAAFLPPFARIPSRRVAPVWPSAGLEPAIAVAKRLAGFPTGKG
jgi:hypothetical protein